MTATAKAPLVYVVLDLETTDADFTKEIDLLEIAATHVDPHTLEVLGSFYCPVLPANLQNTIRKMPDVVKKMHQESGLLQVLAAGMVADDGMPGPNEATQALRTFLLDCGAEVGQRNVILCGNSVGVFDHRVLMQQGRFADLLSHRTVDIGAIERDLKLAGVHVDPSATPINHRAMQDCVAELEAWRNCRAAVRRVLT